MVSVQFFLYDSTYKVVDGKAHIYLYGRALDDGRRLIVIDESFEPYFYAIPKENQDLEELKEKIGKLRIEKDGESASIVRVEIITKKFRGKEIKTFQIFASIPRSVPHFKDVLSRWDSLSSVHEYDILFARRYLIDKGLTPMTVCEVEGELASIRSRVRAIKASKIVQYSLDPSKSPRVLAIDIETYTPKNRSIDLEKNPILMLAFYGENFKKVFVWKKFKTDLPYVEFVDSESALIEKFKETIEEFRPDILTGYYSDGFDLPYIRARAEKYKIKLDIGPDFSEIKSRGVEDSECQINGITHIDIFKFIKRVMRGTLETEGYGLNSVASHLLGQKKQVVDLDELTIIWDKKEDHEGLEKFCEYNLHDTYLAYELCQKMLPTLIELVKMVGLSPYDVSRMGFSQLIEGYLLKEAFKMNEIAPNKPSDSEVGKRRAQSLEGGFVFEPKPGLYRDIAVFDYLSLYPTIIISHNIDLGTLNCECCKESAKKTPEDGYWFCEKRKGFVPTLVEDIITRRLRVKEMMKEADGESYAFLNARQGALKLMANSFYGYLSFYAARWYSIECAKSTTSLGRFYIKRVIQKAEQEKFAVLYSDTDSVFLALDGKKKEDAFEFVKRINDDLPGMMELEFEGFYPSGIFVSAKMGAFGAKKKYALISESGKLKIRGFETIRRNWSLVAKQTQEHVLDIVLREHDPKKAMDYARGVIRDLREKKTPTEKVIIKMQLVKELLDYASKGPHVAAAERMKARGTQIKPGMIIEYVVVSGGNVIRDRVRLPDELKAGEYDAEYYIDNQVIPALDRIFDVLGYSKDEIIGNSKQSTLAGFF